MAEAAAPPPEADTRVLVAAVTLPSPEHALLTNTACARENALPLRYHVGVYIIQLGACFSYGFPVILDDGLRHGDGMRHTGELNRGCL